MDHHHASPAATSIDDEDSDILVQPYLDVSIQTVPSAHSSIGRLAGHSGGGNGKTLYHDNAHARDARWLARTSAVPPTASSVGTFELVQIPQLPSRFARVKES